MVERVVVQTAIKIRLFMTGQYSPNGANAWTREKKAHKAERERTLLRS